VIALPLRLLAENEDDQPHGRGSEQS
jgi:hypothetical protein